MGFGARMVVVNNDTKSHKLTISNINCMYDNGDEGSNLQVWNNVTIAPFTSIPTIGTQYIEVKASGSCAFQTSTFTVNIDNLISFTISEKNNQYYTNSHLNSVDVSIDNGGNGKQAIITVVINCTAVAANWMRTFNNSTGNSFFGKTLSQICLPGSHDAGMYTLTKSTFWSNSCNTQTQLIDIGSQLNSGVRYFDLRPTVWDQSSEMYLGHFSSSSGGQGSLGQDMTSALQQVKNFASNANNSQEIVILKFSHYTTQDDSGFGTTLKKSLLDNYINPILGSVMYKNSYYGVNLGSQTLQSIIDSGQRVICVFDDFSNYINPAAGIFSFGNPNSHNNYCLYDEYANTQFYAKMVDDQVGKWQSFAAGNGNMFLFSFTLTATMGGTTGDCVLAMAAMANPRLTGVLAYYKAANSINSIPNILYIDSVSNINAINSAYYINSLYK